MNDTFNEIFRALPYDIINKNVYFAYKHFVIKAIVRFIKKQRREGIPEPLIFNAIAKTDWTNNVEYWGKYGARMGERHYNTTLVFAEGEKAIWQVFSALEEEMSKLIQGE
jgi:hypothetical protein